MHKLVQKLLGKNPLLKAEIWQPPFNNDKIRKYMAGYPKDERRIVGNIPKRHLTQNFNEIKKLIGEEPTKHLLYHGTKGSNLFNIFKEGGLQSWWERYLDALEQRDNDPSRWNEEFDTEFLDDLGTSNEGDIDRGLVRYVFASPDMNYSTSYLGVDNDVNPMFALDSSKMLGENSLVTARDINGIPVGKFDANYYNSLIQGKDYNRLNPEKYAKLFGSHIGNIEAKADSFTPLSAVKKLFLFSRDINPSADPEFWDPDRITEEKEFKDTKFPISILGTGNKGMTYPPSVRGIPITEDIEQVSDALKKLGISEIPVRKAPLPPDSINISSSDLAKELYIDDFLDAMTKFGRIGFHGTDSNLDTFKKHGFDPSKAAKDKIYGSPLGRGLYVSRNPRFSSIFGKNLYKYVMDKQPRVIDRPQWENRIYPRLVDKVTKDFGLPDFKDHIGEINNGEVWPPYDSVMNLQGFVHSLSDVDKIIKNFTYFDNYFTKRNNVSVPTRYAETHVPIRQNPLGQADETVIPTHLFKPENMVESVSDYWEEHRKSIFVKSNFPRLRYQDQQKEEVHGRNIDRYGESGVKGSQRPGTGYLQPYDLTPGQVMTREDMTPEEKRLNPHLSISETRERQKEELAPVMEFVSKVVGRKSNRLRNVNDTVKDKSGLWQGGQWDRPKLGSGAAMGYHISRTGEHIAHPMLDDYRLPYVGRHEIVHALSSYLDHFENPLGISGLRVELGAPLYQKEDKNFLGIIPGGGIDPIHINFSQKLNKILKDRNLRTVSLEKERGRRFIPIKGTDLERHELPPNAFDNDNEYVTNALTHFLSNDIKNMPKKYPMMYNTAYQLVDLLNKFSGRDLDKFIQGKPQPFSREEILRAQDEAHQAFSSEHLDFRDKKSDIWNRIRIAREEGKPTIERLRKVHKFKTINPDSMRQFLAGQGILYDPNHPSDLSAGKFRRGPYGEYVPQTFKMYGYNEEIPVLSSRGQALQYLQDQTYINELRQQYRDIKRPSYRAPIPEQFKLRSVKKALPRSDLETYWQRNMSGVPLDADVSKRQRKQHPFSYTTRPSKEDEERDKYGLSHSLKRSTFHNTLMDILNGRSESTKYTDWVSKIVSRQPKIYNDPYRAYGDENMFLATKDSEKRADYDPVRGRIRVFRNDDPGPTIDIDHEVTHHLGDILDSLFLSNSETFKNDPVWRNISRKLSTHMSQAWNNKKENNKLRKEFGNYFLSRKVGEPHLDEYFPELLPQVYYPEKFAAISKIAPSVTNSLVNIVRTINSAAGYGESDLPEHLRTSPQEIRRRQVEANTAALLRELTSDPAKEVTKARISPEITYSSGYPRDEVYDIAKMITKLPRSTEGQNILDKTASYVDMDAPYNKDILPKMKKDYPLEIYHGIGINALPGDSGADTPRIMESIAKRGLIPLTQQEGYSHKFRNQIIGSNHDLGLYDYLFSAQWPWPNRDSIIFKINPNVLKDRLSIATASNFVDTPELANKTAISGDRLLDPEFFRSYLRFIQPMGGREQSRYDIDPTDVEYKIGGIIPVNRKNIEKIYIRPKFADLFNEEKFFPDIEHEVYRKPAFVPGQAQPSIVARDNYSVPFSQMVKDILKNNPLTY